MIIGAFWCSALHAVCLLGLLAIAYGFAFTIKQRGPLAASVIGLYLAGFAALTAVTSPEVTNLPAGHARDAALLAAFGCYTLFGIVMTYLCFKVDMAAHFKDLYHNRVEARAVHKRNR